MNRFYDITSSHTGDGGRGHIEFVLDHHARDLAHIGRYRSLVGTVKETGPKSPVVDLVILYVVGNGSKPASKRMDVRDVEHI